MRKILIGILGLLPMILVVTLSMASIFRTGTLQGTVSDVKGNTVTISQSPEGPYRPPVHLEVIVTPQTVFEEADSLSELEEGDAVKIRFIEDRPSGDRLATEIARLPTEKTQKGG